jgi:YVTN family beta-propeller protein
MKTIYIYIIISFFCIGSVQIKAQQLSQYQIVNKIHLDGDEGWDGLTVDESSNRIFVSHGSVVQIVDGSSGTLAGTISGLSRVHCIAIAPDKNKGFITCGGDSSIVVFDLNTFAVLEKINSTGLNPDAITYDNFSGQVFAFNGASSNVTVIDAETNKVSATIILDGKPEFSVTDGKGKVFVNIEDKSMIDEINSFTLQVEQHWLLAPGVEPSGIAIDNVNHRLFSACSNKLMVIVDAVNGNVISTQPIGDRVDGADFDTGLKRVYSPNGEGSLTVIQESDKDNFSVIETFETQKGARTIALNSKTHHIYLPTAEFDPAPEPTPENPKPRPKIRPNSFTLLDVVFSN